MYSVKQYINGELVEGTGMRIGVVCPGNGETIGELNAAGPEQAQAALEAARDAFPSWSRLTAQQRGVWIIKLRDALMEHRQMITEMMAHETGKPISQAAEEIGWLDSALLGNLDLAKAQQEEMVHDPLGKSLNLIIREPLGVVVGYLAWNYPVSNVAVKLGPVLASGCTAVLKPATKTPLATLFIGEIMQKMGFPKGVINIIAGPAKQLGEVLTKSTIPAVLSIIGSSQAGRDLVRDSATSIKKFNLELGGNAPVIVTRNANLDMATGAAFGAKTANCGQLCVSPQRVLVDRSVHAAFIDRVRAMAANIRYGTLYEECDVGPMITPEAVTRIEALVADALKKGAKLITGGKRPVGRLVGNFYELTVLDGVTPDMRAFREEVFGPILTVTAYDDLDKAIEMANDTEYGLFSYAFCDGLVETNKIVRGLQFGTVSVNGGGGPNMPHGGIKESGVGKGGSHIGLDELYYYKSVGIAVV